MRITSTLIYYWNREHRMCDMANQSETRKFDDNEALEAKVILTIDCSMRVNMAHGFECHPNRNCHSFTRSSHAWNTILITHFDNGLGHECLCVLVLIMPFAPPRAVDCVKTQLRRSTIRNAMYRHKRLYNVILIWSMMMKISNHKVFFIITGKFLLISKYKMDLNLDMIWIDVKQSIMKTVFYKFYNNQCYKTQKWM